MKVPFFRNFTPLTQIFTVFSMHFLGYIVATFIVFLIARPFWNINIFTHPEQFSNLTDPAILNLHRLTMIISVLFVFITPATIFRRYMELEGQDYLAVRTAPRLKSIGIVIILFLICFPVSNFLYYINVQIDLSFISDSTAQAINEAEISGSKYTQSILFTDSFTTYMINLVAIAVLTAIGEELIFRSILQRLFVKMFSNVHVAVFCCAALFSLMHFSYYGFLLRMFMGVMLGYIYLATANIWYCIIFHFLNNAMAITFAWLMSKGMVSDYADTFGAEGFARWIALALLVGITAWGLMRIKKYLNRSFIQEIKQY